VPEIISVGMAEIRVARPPDKLAVRGIGSCVVLALWDPEAKVGGLAHSMLPTAAAQPGGEEQPAKYCDTAVGALLEAMVAAGARKERCSARLVGGATMFSFPGKAGAMMTLGERNLFASRETLQAWRLPLTAEECGGDRGRSIELDPSDGTVMVWSAFQSVRWL
jgi:chemotaxis protein CheD